MYSLPAFSQQQEPSAQEKSVREKTSNERKAAHERMVKRYGYGITTFALGQRHVLEDGTIIEPDGTFKFTNGTTLSPGGKVTLPNGDILKKGQNKNLPDGTSVTNSEGTGS